MPNYDLEDFKNWISTQAIKVHPIDNDIETKLFEELHRNHKEDFSLNPYEAVECAYFAVDALALEDVFRSYANAVNNWDLEREREQNKK